VATTTLYATSHVNGSCTNPDAALGVADGTWTTDTSNTSWTSLWQIDALPAGSVSVGTQTMTIRCRKHEGTGTPTITVTQYSSGSLVTTLVSNQSITSLTGQDVVLTFTTSGEDPDVEIQVACAAVGGGPSTRASVQIDSFTWSATYGSWQTATAAATTTTTAAATPAAMSKSRAATGVTVSTTPAAAATTSKPATATGVTVEPIARADMFLLQPEHRGISGSGKTYGTVNGRLGTRGLVDHVEYTEHVIVAITAAATSTVERMGAAANATVTFSATAIGDKLGFPTGEAHATITPTAAATPADKWIYIDATDTTVPIATTAASSSANTMPANTTVVVVTPQAFGDVEGQPIYESWGPIPILVT